MDLQLRGYVFFGAAFVCGIVSVLIARLCPYLIQKQPGSKAICLGGGILANALLAGFAASCWQTSTPIMYEHAFGAKNFKLLLESPDLIVFTIIVSSLGVLLGYGLGVICSFAAVKSFKPLALVAAAFPVAFLVIHQSTTERLPRGYENTVEVRLHYSHDDPDWVHSIDEFYKWAGTQACPYANYDAWAVFRGKDETGPKEPTPRVTIVKYYYRNNNMDDRLGSVLKTELNGPVDAAAIREAVASIQAARTSLTIKKTKP